MSGIRVVTAGDKRPEFSGGLCVTACFVIGSGSGKECHPHPLDHQASGVFGTGMRSTYDPRQGSGSFAASGGEMPVGDRVLPKDAPVIREVADMAGAAEDDHYPEDRLNSSATKHSSSLHF